MIFQDPPGGYDAEAQHKHEQLRQTICEVFRRNAKSKTGGNGVTPFVKANKSDLKIVIADKELEPEDVELIQQMVDLARFDAHECTRQVMEMNQGNL